MPLGLDPDELLEKAIQIKRDRKMDNIDALKAAFEEFGEKPGDHHKLYFSLMPRMISEWKKRRKEEFRKQDPNLNY